MTRTRVTAALLMAATVLTLSAVPAQAQDYPGTTAPGICNREISSRDALLPNATVRLRIVCSLFVNGHRLHGTGNSSPYALEPGTVVVDKAVTYTVKLPADYELNARHTVTLLDIDANERLVASIPYFVDSKGRITAGPSSATTIPRTGSPSHTGDLVKSGIVLLAFGGLAVRISRRRHQRAAVAV